MAVKDYLPDRHGVLRPTSQLVCIRSVQSSTGRRSPGGAYDLLLRAECRGDVLSDRTPRGIVAASGRLHGDAAIRRAGEASAERVVSLGGANRGASRKRTRRVAPKKRYQVGDWFAVSIFGHGYVVGRVDVRALVDDDRLLLRATSCGCPSLDEVKTLRPKDAFSYSICGVLAATRVSRERELRGARGSRGVRSTEVAEPGVRVHGSPRPGVGNPS